MNMTDGNSAENTSDIKILRNALIEGLSSFTAFFVGSSMAGLRLDSMAWTYGALGSFLTGFVAYLSKAYLKKEVKK